MIKVLFQRRQRGFSAMRNGLFRVSEELFLRCGTVLSAVRKSLFRGPEMRRPDDGTAQTAVPQGGARCAREWRICGVGCRCVEKSE